jgi:hypothetical protein
MSKVRKENFKLYAFVENKGTEDEQLFVHIVDNCSVDEVLAVVEVLVNDLIDKADFSYLDIQKYLFGEKLKRDSKNS